MAERTIVDQYGAYRDDIADLVTRRPVPGPKVDQIDPFLFLNHHGPQTYRPGNNGLPFGPHPHRGFETVTFILEGSLSHKDTGGHESIIHAGGVQWMTAGSGLVHAELSPAEFKRDGGDLEILQLWVNLPARLKMTEPRYVGLQDADIPKVSLGEAVTAHLVSGTLGGEEGPIPSHTDVMMSWVRLEPGAGVTLPAPKGRNVFFYTVRGAVSLGATDVPSHRLVRFADDGDEITVTAGEEEALILYGHADPIDEPVVAHGPFVMNTAEEINQAIRDYRAGLFDRQPPQRTPASA